MQISYRLHLPRESATVPLVRALCQDTMAELGVCSDDVDDVSLAITEACANVVVHAAGSADYDVHVEVGIRDCDIRVVDSGVGFSGDGRSRDMPPPTERGGRGLALMEQLMDQIDFDGRAQAGTILHLRKRLTLTDGSPLWSFTEDGDDQ